MTVFKIGHLQQAKDWDGWGARVRTADGEPIQIERTQAITLDKTGQDPFALAETIASTAQDLIDPKATFVETGGQGFKGGTFLVVSGWTTELTPAEASEAQRLGFK